MSDIIFNFTSKDWANGDLITESDLDRIESSIELLYSILGEDAAYQEYAELGRSVFTFLAEVNARLNEIQNLSGQLEDAVAAEVSQYISTTIEELRQQIALARQAANDAGNAANNATTAANNATTAAQNATANATTAATNAANSVISTVKSRLGLNYYTSEGEVVDNQRTVTTDINAIIDVLGTQYYNNGWVGNVDSISTRLNTLSQNVGMNSASIDSLVPRVVATESDVDNLESSVTTLGSTVSGLNTNLDNLQDAVEVIQDYLGTGTQQGGGTTLVNKIQAALGRNLEYTAAEAEEDPIAATPLLTTIRSILDTLGMEGGESSGQSSSTLINDVEMALNLLYGYTLTEENNETIITRNVAPNLTTRAMINGYSTLYNDFYNNNGSSIPTQINAVLSTVSDLSRTVTSLSTTVGSYSSAIADINTKYCDADIVRFDGSDNVYLALKRIAGQQAVTSEDDIANDTNITYVLLPQMGGGGGVAEYELDANIIQQTYVDPDTQESSQLPIFPANNTITIGNEYLTRFIWSVTQNNTPQTIDGVLTIRLNNIVVDTRYIMSNTDFTLDLGQYITSTGRNAFVLMVSNAAVRSRTLYTTITAYSANLTSTFNADAIQTGSTINFPYTASIGSNTIEKTLHITIDGEPIALIGNSSTSESLRSVTFETPSAGDHIIRAWFTATITNSGMSNTISSAVLSYSILCGISNNTRIAVNAVPTSIEQYNTLTINYLVVTPNEETTVVNFYINGSTTPIVEEVRAVHTNFEYTVSQPGGVLTIRIEANGAEKIIQLDVIANAAYDFSIVTEGLKVNLDAEGKTNAASNRAQWLNTAALSNEDSYNNVQGTLNNFLYYTEGNYDGWLRNANGRNYLRLRNRDTVSINLPIFNFNIANNKVVDGMTFEVDFQTQDVTDYSAPIISCYEQGVANKFIRFTAQDLTINNTMTLKTQFKEEDRLTVTIVVENSDRGPLYQLFKIYINGILSAANVYETVNGLNFANLSNSIIELGSSKCTLDIYAIRFYNRALSFPEVIKNWIANEDTYQKKIQFYNRNNYGNSQGRITMTENAFTLASPTTPYMIIRANGDWNDEDGRQAMPTKKADGTYTTEDEGKEIMVEYVDPLDPTKSFTTDFEGGSVGIAIQGTSSQEYKRKNYKIKLNVFKQNGITHVKKPNKSANKDQYYTDNTYTTLKEGYSAEGYKFIDTSIPTFTFCIKADVASSESANNTLLVKMYNEIVKNVELTPPQGDDANIRQGVDGYPMVVWFFNDFTKEYIFLGKYNFNNDKGTEEVYGLQDGDESWEVGNNEKLLCKFDTSEDPNWTNWRTAFETRYPDDDDELTKKGETPYTDEQIADRLAGLKEVVNWVSDNVSWVDSNTKSAVVFNNTVTNADITTAAATGRTAAAEAFRREFKQYFNMDLMTFFFVYTEFFLMVDNRAKNMFLTRYKVANNRPANPAWHTTYGDNVVELQASTSTRDNYAGWFSLPYDMDTGIGTNNVGVYTFDYHYETGDLQPSGVIVFNGQDSKLWVAFTQVFGPEIEAMYRRFQTYTSYKSLETRFEEHQGVWSETVVNEDMIAKYLDWITAYYDEEHTEPQTRDARALPMLLGLKTEQRKWWLENRFKYMNSKYAIDATSDNISLGLQSGQLNIPVQVYADSYVTFKVGASDSAPTTIRVRIGETGLIQRTASAGAGGADRVESSLSPASRISSVSNLANLNLLNADFSNAIRLQTLRIGSATIINNRLESVGLRSNTLLRLFDLRNCAAYTQDLSVTNCNSLEYIYLGGTNISNVNLPQGGILKTIQYPTSITTINIIKHPYLENIIIGNSLPEDEIQTEEQGNVSVFNGINDYSNITSITLDGIGPTTEQILANPVQYDTMSPDVAAIIMESAVNASCSISNIAFYMTGAQFKQLFNRLIAINASVNNCTIILKDALPSDLTVDKIVEQFSGFKVYDQNGNEYYNVRFYDFNRALIGTISLIGGADNNIQSDIYKEYFTREYLNNYNGITNENASSHETRIGFGGWDTSLVNISSDLDVYPLPATQYRVDFHYLINETTPAVYYDYFAVGDTVTRFDTSTLEFIYNYYKYQVSGWTSDSNQPANYPDDDNREIISGYIIKQSGVESFYAVYQHNTPAPYTIRVFNTNINGEVPENAQPLTTFTKNIVGANHLILPSDLNSYLPSNNNLSIACIDSNESGVAIENRKYQFLNWNPYVPAGGLQVRGDMDIDLMYYKTDDYFTNYFINKLVNCNLGTVTRIPEGAFNHNSNLRKLAANTPYIGDYTFCSFNESNAPRRYFTFSGSDIEIGRDAFNGINNAVIIFDGANAQIVVDQRAFYMITNCIIIVLNSTLPIQRKPNTYDQFYYLGGQNTNNIIYLPEAARAQYTNTSNENIPDGLRNSGVLYYFDEDGQSMATVNALVEEARINDN